MIYKAVITLSSTDGWAARSKVISLDLNFPEAFEYSGRLRLVELVRDAQFHANPLMPKAQLYRRGAA